MDSSASTIRVSGLPREKLAALREQAKMLGMSAEGYARQLIENGVSLKFRARRQTLDELFAPVRAQFRKSGMTEAELDKIVDAARTRHHRRTSRKKI